MQRDGGMREYLLNKSAVVDMIGTPAGIFVFPDGPIDDFDEAGCVWFQAVTKKSLKVVLLNVTYELDDIKGPIRPKDTLRLNHDGAFGENSHWPYHQGKELRVLRGPISLDRIMLVRSYDISDVVAHARELTVAQ